jgi:citrate synthase
MKNGLEDVIAAETRLSDVDGEAGRCRPWTPCAH